MSVAGRRANRLHVRVGDFELLIAIARESVPDDDDQDAETETNY